MSNLATWTQTVPLMRAGYHREMLEKVAVLRTQQPIFPPRGRVFRALELIPFHAVKVVIVGQDPYHGAGQADGLAFSVPEAIGPPPSLRNIFKEIADDIYGGDPPRFSSDLTRWAEQGVLLLNTSLTVEAGNAGSHRDLGWSPLTDALLAQLSEMREHLAFLLWGRAPQRNADLIDTDRHLILMASHPSPLSAYRGFLGCRHFSKANAYLARHGRTPIRW